MKQYLALFGIIAAALLPFSVRAFSFGGGSETAFGGMHILTLDSEVCTCSGNSHWILDYTQNSLLRLYYQPGSSRLYSNNNLEGTYEVGTYQKGQSESCMIYVAEDCIELTNDGTYGSSPGTGTSSRDASYASAVNPWSVILAGNPYANEIKAFMTASTRFTSVKEI